MILTVIVADTFYRLDMFILILIFSNLNFVLTIGFYETLSVDTKVTVWPFSSLSFTKHVLLEYNLIKMQLYFVCISLVVLLIFFKFLFA